MKGDESDDHQIVRRSHNSVKLKSVGQDKLGGAKWLISEREYTISYNKQIGPMNFEPIGPIYQGLDYSAGAVKLR